MKVYVTLPQEVVQFFRENACFIDGYMKFDRWLKYMDEGVYQLLDEDDLPEHVKEMNKIIHPDD